VAHLARRRSWHIKEAHISATRLPARKRCRRDYPSAPGMFWRWRGLSLWSLGICKPEGGGSMYPAACNRRCFTATRIRSDPGQSGSCRQGAPAPPGLIGVVVVGCHAVTQHKQDPSYLPVCAPIRTTRYSIPTVPAFSKTRVPFSASPSLKPTRNPMNIR
jgi:hypothetical protein